MLSKKNSTSYIIDKSSLDPNFPTHMHDSYFWECLGRTVATFGCLEETLLRAIFVLEGTKQHQATLTELEFDKWVDRIVQSMSDPLGNLIDKYGKAAKEYHTPVLDELNSFLELLRKSSSLRNALCHASWRAPDNKGYSKLFYVNKKFEQFNSEVDVNYLNQVREHVSELIAEVMSSITNLGFQFPGSEGPGKKVW